MEDVFHRINVEAVPQNKTVQTQRMCITEIRLH